MAIGESSYFTSGSENNATRRNNEYSYYSRYSFLSADKKVSLRFEFRSGLMQCKLYTRTSDEGSWNQDPTEVVYLSYMKATLLDKEIQKFKDYINSEDKPNPDIAFGVNGGMNDKVAFIAFHASPDKELLITIGKFDGNGNIVEQCTYKSSVDYNYGLDWNKLDDMDLNKAYYNNIELDLIHQMVKDFSRSMSGANGYGVHDIGRYDLGRVLSKMDPIYDKLGIEKYNSNNSRYRGNNNFLDSIGNNGDNSSRSSSGSIDDLIS